MYVLFLVLFCTEREITEVKIGNFRERKEKIIFVMRQLTYVLRIKMNLKKSKNKEGNRTVRAVSVSYVRNW